MNERIRELVNKAIGDVDYIRNDDDLDRELAKMYIPDCFAEKFAELIVRECLNKIEQAGTYFNTQPQYTDAQNKLVDEGFTWGVESCQVMVKQHFGVEE